ncbi:ABC-2 family transporter protein [Fructilactobacillus frigidiflavus]|uniref:ABC-2 family transporter protein n=1 Tax=Fructilactobacillus frigidiflavus TaxID=3242688 RepID=UPI0037576E27
MKIALYWELAKQSFKEFTTYRFTSAMVITFGFMFTLIELFAGKVYFSFSNSIGNFTYNQYQLMIMFLSCMVYTYQFLFIGAQESLAADINKGDLDYHLIRPINSYVYYVFKQLDFPSLINLIVYIFVTAYYLLKFQIEVWQIILIIFYYAIGVIFIFSLNQIVIEVSFWKDNLTALNGVPEYLIDSANRPASIYPKIFRMILINIIPVIPLSNEIVQLTSRDFASRQSIYLLSMLFTLTLIFTFFSYVLWKKGLKHYYSAS